MSSSSISALREPLGALREVPYMGVIWVVHEASKLGFTNGSPEWCNLGQGQPEVGAMEGAPPRIASVELAPGDHAYGPLGGTLELREAVATHVNRLFRGRKRSQYGPENVCIASGGRLSLTRAFAALGAVNVGYQVPDYTAYEDMFELHLARLHPVPIRARKEDGFLVPPERIDEEVVEKGLSAFVLSNPCNPTGNLLQGDELARLVAIARERGTTLLLDEFYSHFVYTADGKPGAGPVSAAAYVENVERDPVILFDGLTKSFRYPGWRVGWALGPSEMIQTMARTASSIDGGPVEDRAARRAARARAEAGGPGDARAARDVREEAQPARGAARADRDPLRARAALDVLRLGEPRGIARAAERRDVLFPPRARAEGDDGAGRVLRREPGQAAARSVAVRAVDALLVRPADGQPAPRARPARGDGR
jgi:aspartate/methionine/tyrosine aminotransferase